MIKAFILPRNQFDFDGALACTVVCVGWAADLFARGGKIWNLEEMVTFANDEKRLSDPEFTMAVACKEWRRRWPGVMTHTFEVIESQLYPNVKILEECTAMVGGEGEEGENSMHAEGRDQAYGTFKSVLMKWVVDVQNTIGESMLVCTRCNISLIVGWSEGRYWLLDPHAFTMERIEQLKNICPTRGSARCYGRVGSMSGASMIGFIMKDHLIEYMLKYITGCSVSEEAWKSASEEERQQINWFNEIYCVQLVPNKP